MVEHRKVLRDKVERQQKLLEQALRKSESDGHPAERISAISTELSVVADSVSGGWDTMSDATADRLSRWLESTRTLIPSEKSKGTHKAEPGRPQDDLVQEVSAAPDKVDHHT